MVCKGGIHLIKMKWKVKKWKMKQKLKSRKKNEGYFPATLLLPGNTHHTLGHWILFSDPGLQTTTPGNDDIMVPAVYPEKNNPLKGGGFHFFKKGGSDPLGRGLDSLSSSTKMEKSFRFVVKLREYTWHIQNFSNQSFKLALKNITFLDSKYWNIFDLRLRMENIPK